MMKVRVGLIGVSGYGHTHFVNWSGLVRQGKVELAAAAVINPDQVPDQLAVLKEFGTHVYPSADAMFEAEKGKLDLVSIPTGIAYHEPMTVAALAAGANVLVEKPAAGSVAAVERMMEAEKNSGRFVAVGFQHTYAREVQFIKKYLLGGRLGEVRRIVCSGIWPRADQYYARNSWAGKLAMPDGTPVLDSPINNAFAHYLNLQLFFAGSRFAESAHAVSVEGNLYRARKTIETFDSCALRFRTGNGIELVTLLSHTCENKSDPSIRIECSGGEVFWQAGHTWNIRSARGELLHSGLAEMPNSDMFKDVVRKVSGETTFCCPLTIAAEHTRCIEMLTGELTPVELTESVTRIEETGQYVLDQVEAVFADCFLRGALPAERGVVWT